MPNCILWDSICPVPELFLSPFGVYIRFGSKNRFCTSHPLHARCKTYALALRFLVFWRARGGDIAEQIAFWHYNSYCFWSRSTRCGFRSKNSRNYNAKLHHLQRSRRTCNGPGELATVPANLQRSRRTCNGVSQLATVS